MTHETNIAQLPTNQIKKHFEISQQKSDRKRAIRLESLAAGTRFRLLMAGLMAAAGVATYEVASYATGNPGASETTTVPVRDYNTQNGFDNAWQIANRLRVQHLVSESPGDFTTELDPLVPHDATHPNGAGSLKPGDKIIVSNGHVTGFKEAGNP